MNAATSLAQTKNPADERERLALLCQLDRAQISLLLRSIPLRAPQRPGPLDIVQGVLQAARFLPGKAGRFARQVAFFERYVQPFFRGAFW